MRRPIRTAALIVAFILAAAIFAGWVESARAACHPEPVTPDTPTGIAGCVIYGRGIASHWNGAGVARNDCTWPWTDCTPIRITALTTGRSITVTPTMFGDLYTGTPQQRIVDLDRAAVAALGLDWSAGLYPVRVQPATAALPDTAMLTP